MTSSLMILLAGLAVAACGASTPQPVPSAQPTTASGPAVAAPPKVDAPVTPSTPAEPTRAAPPPPPDLAQQKAVLASAELAAYETAKPALGKYCASCHTTVGKKAAKKKLDHFSMDTYPFGGEHAKSIGNEIRVVLAIDGNKKASMPSDKPGAVNGDELAAIKAWTEAWQASGAAGNHPAEPADKDDD
jgi:hypothetical protein